MTKTVYRPSRIVAGKRVQARLYRLAYRVDWMPGKKYRSLRTADKQVAEKRATEFLRELEQEHAGVGFSRLQRESGIRPLLELLELYVDDLRGRGRARMYCYTVEKRIRNILVGCGWNTLPDVRAVDFQMWRNAQASAGRAAKTLKDYQDAIGAFLKWLVRSDRCEENPLDRLERVKTRGAKTRTRRAFTFQELERLLSVSGPRRLGYLAAFFTGLRRAELRRLEWGDVHLDGERPFLAVRAATTKNGHAAHINLHAQLVAALRTERPEGVEADRAVLSKRELASMFMMKKDLKAAGIGLADGQGRRADFHALRGSLNTHLALAKTDPQIRQRVMRHSDIRLTLDTYTDGSMLPVWDSVASLPAFGQGATVRATGLDISGQNVAQAGTTALENQPLEVPLNERLSPELAALGTNGHEPGNGCLTRIRT